MKDKNIFVEYCTGCGLCHSTIGTEFEKNVKDLIPYVKRFERAFPGVLK